MGDKIVDITVVGHDVYSARRELERILRDFCIRELLTVCKLKNTNAIQGYRFRVTFASDVSEFCEEDQSLVKEVVANGNDIDI